MQIRLVINTNANEWNNMCEWNKQEWTFERSSGYAGWRCGKCAKWVYDGQKLECRCSDNK